MHHTWKAWAGEGEDGPYGRRYTNAQHEVRHATWAKRGCKSV